MNLLNKNVREKIERRLRDAHEKYLKAKESGEIIDLSKNIASEEEHYDSILNTWIEISEENKSYVSERLIENAINLM